MDTISRPLPNNLEAERAVLGAILLDINHYYSSGDRLSPESFYFKPHQLIFAAMARLMEGSQPVDPITLRNALGPDIESVGGASYISSLTDGLQHTVNFGHYVEIVKDKELLRNLIEHANQSINDCLQKEEQDDAREILDRAEKEIFRLAEGYIRSDYVHIGKLTMETLKQAEELAKHHAVIRGVPTGYGDFDAMTGGFQGGDLVVLAARPGMGKSTFCLNVAANASLRFGKTVAIFSLEDSSRHIVRRLLCTVAKVNAEKVGRGINLTREDWADLSRAASELTRAPLYIDDNPSTILELKTKARRIKHEHNGLDLMIVDYLQLIQASQTRFENRTLEIAAYTQALKNIAKELNIPVIAVSQLNRGIEQRPDNRPRLADLRESGAIEQDADLVCFLYRDMPKRRGRFDGGGDAEPYDPTAAVPTTLTIAKHRNGPIGDVNLVFFPSQTRFESATRYEDTESAGVAR